MKIERMNKGEWGKLRAFFDLRTNEGMVVKGFKIIEGINGMFVGMPSQKGKEEEYFDTVFMDQGLREELSQVAMEAYSNPSFANPTPQPNNNSENTVPKEESMPDELVPADTAETVQPFDDNDIPF